MKTSPEKFQAIAVGKKTHDKNLKFNLEGNEIECETEVKLLGVTIDFKLNFINLLMSVSVYERVLSSA
jgi:hypothetical protein